MILNTEYRLITGEYRGWEAVPAGHQAQTGRDPRRPSQVQEHFVFSKIDLKPIM